MSQSSDSESSDSDNGIRYQTDKTKCRSKSGSKDLITKSVHREKSRHKSRKHGKKRHGSSDDESSRPKKRKHKDKSERKEKKKSKKKKRKKEKKVESTDSDSADNSFKETRDQKSNNRIIGPAMPEHLLDNQSETSKQSNIIGPVLPSNFINPTQDASQPNEDEHSIGPMLPAHPKQAHPGSSKETIGPTRPSHEETGELPQKIIGPTLPPHLKDKLVGSEKFSKETIPSDDEDMYGPLPAGAALSRAHIELEERALQMQIDKLDPKGQDEPSREEWMTELPAAKAANFGLGPRQFRTKAGPDLSDRSSWTDTPQDKANKKSKKTEPPVDYKREAELSALHKRDKEQEALIKKMKRNEESLVEMHTKKMKNKEDSGPQERRPFSRDIDLQVNRFDEAQKKAVLKKAQLLDSRFSSGESKYL